MLDPAAVAEISGIASLLVNQRSASTAATNIDVLAAGGRIVNVSPGSLQPRPGPSTPRASSAAAVRRRALPHGRIRSRTARRVNLERHAAARGHRAVGRASNRCSRRRRSWSSARSRYCDWAVAKGLLAIRSHVDVCDPRLLAVEGAAARQEKVAVPRPAARRVPQDGVLRSPTRNPDARARDGRGRRRRHPAFRAHDARRAERAPPVRDRGGAGRLVDMHCDGPTTRSAPHRDDARAQTQRLGLAGPRERLAPHVHAPRWTTTTSKLIPLMVGGGG